MKPEELRIGNLFTQKGSQFVETASYETLELLSRGAIIPVGIPLTEKWLRSFGFKETAEGYFEVHDCVIYLDQQKMFIANGEGYGIDNDIKESKMIESEITLPKHAHRLQNIYFALTGEELTIKE